jgi:hypothetical protein
MSRQIFLILFLFLALLVSVFLTLKVTIYSSKASTRQVTLTSLANSYLFASPIQAKADGQELIRLTVFLLDGQGLGIAGQKIDLLRSQTLTVHETQPLTDDAGKAIFDLSSLTAGAYELTARIAAKNLPQKVKIIFY